jgi:hypothetical protein
MCTHRIGYILVPVAGLLLGACTTQPSMPEGPEVAKLAPDQSEPSRTAPDATAGTETPTYPATQSQAPASSSAPSQATEAQQAKREAADGFIRAIGTTQVSVLDEGGAVKRRIPRDRIKIGARGIPYRYHAPGSDHLIIADLGQGEMLLDSAEFDIDPKEALVSRKCESIRTGSAPSNNSAASMGHGERCQ